MILIISFNNLNSETVYSIPMFHYRGIPGYTRVYYIPLIHCEGIDIRYYIHTHYITSAPLEPSIRCTCNYVKTHSWAYKGYLQAHELQNTYKTLECNVPFCSLTNRQYRETGVSKAR